jgi:general stress protein 26
LKALKEMSKTMAEIDFAMLTTRTDGGQLATRQMSNNGEVEYDGDSFYFSWDSAGPVNDIGRASGRLVVPGKRGAARQAANVHRGRRNGADRALAVFMDGDEACS